MHHYLEKCIGLVPSARLRRGTGERNLNLLQHEVSLNRQPGRHDIWEVGSTSIDTAADAEDYTESKEDVGKAPAIFP